MPADLNYIKIIAAIKEKKNYVCVNCGNNEYYKIKTTYSRKCKNCKRVESVLAHTAFEGIRMPLSKAINVFEVFQKKFIKRSYEIEDNQDDYDEGRLSSQKSEMRLTTLEMAKFIGIRQEAC